MMILQKLKIELSHDSAIVGSYGIYVSGYIPNRIGKQGLKGDMFRATVLTTAKRWEAPKCPSMNEKVSKM